MVAACKGMFGVYMTSRLGAIVVVEDNAEQNYWLQRVDKGWTWWWVWWWTSMPYKRMKRVQHIVTTDAVKPYPVVAGVDAAAGVDWSAGSI